MRKYIRTFNYTDVIHLQKDVKTAVCGLKPYKPMSNIPENIATTFFSELKVCDKCLAKAKEEAKNEVA